MVEPGGVWLGCFLFVEALCFSVMCGLGGGGNGPVHLYVRKFWGLFMRSRGNSLQEVNGAPNR